MKTFIAFLLPVLLSVQIGFTTGCSTYDAVGAGNTVAQKTYALYGEFTIAKNVLANIVTDKSTPDSVAKVLITANRVATPLVRTAVDLAKRYVDVKAQYDEAQRVGSDTSALLSTMSMILSQLTQAYSQAEPEARRLINTVRDVKG